MLRIRLKRVGRRNDPSFRVVVVDGRQGPKSGLFVEQLGHYNPKTKEKALDAERAKYWLSVGAQPSDTVYNMLVDAGAVEGKKKNVLPRKSPVVKEEETKEVEASPDAEIPAEPEANVGEAPILSPTESEESRSEDRGSSIGSGQNRESSISRPNQKDLGEIGKKPEKKENIETQT